MLRVLGSCPNPQTLEDAPEGLRQKGYEVGGRSGFAEDGDEEEGGRRVKVNVPELPGSQRGHWLSLIWLIAFSDM